jgi:cyclase
LLKELANGVYVETEFEGGNVGLILTDRGALLVDTPMLPPEARQWQWRLTQLGVKDLYGLVNTDYHPEHVLGNAVFMPTRILGHEFSTRPLARYKPAVLEQVSAAYRDKDPQLAQEIMDLEVYGPEICVEDRLTLYIGDRTIEILHLDGHTTASLGVYLPRERVLFAGDNIVHNEHPVMVHANTLEWLESLALVQRMEIDTLVPGSGAVCGKEAIAPLESYIREMRDRVTEQYLKGASRREAVDKVGLLDSYPVPESQATRIKRRRRESIERVYAEIRTQNPRSRHA